MSIKRNKETPAGQGLPKDPPKVILPDPEQAQVDLSKIPLVGGSGDDGKSGSGKSGNGGSQKGKGKEQKSNPITEARQFLKEVIIEFRKISWPEPRTVVRETWSVLFLVALITVMVLAFDWVLANAVFTPLEHFARLHGGGIGSQ